jgi:hypothetical protein
MKRGKRLQNYGLKGFAAENFDAIKNVKIENHSWRIGLGGIYDFLNWKGGNKLSVGLKSRIQETRIHYIFFIPK